MNCSSLGLASCIMHYVVYTSDWDTLHMHAHALSPRVFCKAMYTIVMRGCERLQVPDSHSLASEAAHGILAMNDSVCWHPSIHFSDVSWLHKMGMTNIQTHSYALAPLRSSATVHSRPKICSNRGYLPAGRVQ